MGFGGGGAAPRRTYVFALNVPTTTGTSTTNTGAEPTQFGQTGSVLERLANINLNAIKGAGTILSARMIGAVPMRVSSTGVVPTGHMKMALRLAGSATPVFTAAQTEAGTTAVQHYFEYVLTASDITNLLLNGDCFWSMMGWMTGGTLTQTLFLGNGLVGEPNAHADLLIEVENP